MAFSKSSLWLSLTCRALPADTRPDLDGDRVDGRFITVRSAATSVVLLPLPVGPVRITMPCGLLIAS